MKAVRYNRYGGPEVLEVQEAAKPALVKGRVLVEVHSAAINPFDYKLRSGLMKDSVPLNFPVTIGADFSGVIVGLADDTGGLEVGGEVYGSAIILNGGSGAMAEYAAANAVSIAPKPSSLGHEQAAAIVLTGVSAYQAIDELKLVPGQKILIHGGAGGIGSAAIQYAKHLGAYVATTARADEADFVRGLGTNESIDYENQKFEDVIKGYDAVFDTVGGETYQRSLGVLKAGGRIISMVEHSDDNLAKSQGVTMLFQSTKVDTDSLNQLKALVDAGVIKPQVDRQFPLQQAAEAFRYAENARPKGKVVVKIR